MTSYEGADENRAKVLAAAHATASWVRARRATWTDAPLPVPTDGRSVRARAGFDDGRFAPAETAPFDAAPFSRVPSGVPVPTPDLGELSRTETTEPERQAPHEDAGPSKWEETIRPAVGRWAPRLAAVALAGLGAAAAVRYGPSLWRAASSSASRIAANAAKSSATAAPAEPAKTTGAIHIVSTPAGARVLVDGQPRGITPMTLDEVEPGRHTVVLQGSAGTIQRVVAVAPGTTAEVDESIFSGWVVVYAPFEIAITEGGRPLRPDDRNEIMLPAGPHDLRFVSRLLGFEETRHVDLKPGDRVSISIKPAQTSISVTASEPAEIWIDGVRLGEAPIASAPVDLGTHELVARRLAGGERRMTIRATVRPVSIVVDFTRPPA